MIDFETLPKEPNAALKFVLESILRAIPNGNEPLKKHSRSLTQTIEIETKAALLISKRVSDETLKSIAAENLHFVIDKNVSQFSKEVKKVHSALLVSFLDEHFLDHDSVLEFDTVELSESDRKELFSLMETARRLTQEATYLSKGHKRRIILRISDVENELYKEKSRFRAFLAAAADVSELVKQFGENAKPLAKAIQDARSSTERKIEGYQRIEADDEQKKLPSPDTISGKDGNKADPTN